MTGKPEVNCCNQAILLIDLSSAFQQTLLPLRRPGQRLAREGSLAAQKVKYKRT